MHRNADCGLWVGWVVVQQRLMDTAGSISAPISEAEFISVEIGLIDCGMCIIVFNCEEVCVLDFLRCIF